MNASNTYIIALLSLFTDDPYYCGLRARVPNFVKSSKIKGKESASPMKRISVSNMQHPAASLASLHQLHQIHPQHFYVGSHQAHSQYAHHMMLHTRSFESGIGKLEVVAYILWILVNWLFFRFRYDWIAIQSSLRSLTITNAWIYSSTESYVHWRMGLNIHNWFKLVINQTHKFIKLSFLFKFSSGLA